jgi:hypothetical protein
MSNNVTITDKDREVKLIADGKWHHLMIKGRSGSIRASHPMDVEGTYLLEVALLGRATALVKPAYGGPMLDMNVVRYPSLDSTAWMVMPLRLGQWFDTKGGLKVVCKFKPTVPTEGKEFGIDYRLAKGNVVYVEQRMLKFVWQGS